MNIIGPILLIAGIWGGAWLITLYVNRSVENKHPERDWRTLERIETGLKGLEDLFSANEEFCPMCYTHQYWWSGGGSWSVDRCPFHKQSDDAILWKNMTRGQRKVSAKRHDEMWKQKFGVHFFNATDRKLLD